MNPFEMTLLALLQERAKEDALFAETLKKPNKSIAECAKYIYGELAEEARKNKDGQTACVGVPKADVIAMAVHYFDEDDITIKPINAAVKTATPSAPKSKDAKKETKKAETAKTAKTETKKAVKKNLLLESLKNTPKKEEKPKLTDIATKGKDAKKETKKANDFVGSLFDF